MSTGRRGSRRVPVVIDPGVWREEVERLTPRSSARVAAERERRRLESDGIAEELLERCDAQGRDGTQLAGLLKAYVPLRRLRRQSVRSDSSSGPAASRGSLRSIWPHSGSAILGRGRAACTSGRTNACTVGIPTSDGSPVATDGLDLLPDLEPCCQAQVAHAVGHVGLIGALRRISGNHRDPKPGALP